MHAAIGVLLVTGLIALTASQVAVQRYYGRKGREARAANGGRHTTSYWVSIGFAVIVVVILIGLWVLR